MVERHSETNKVRRTRHAAHALDALDRTLLALLLDDARQKYATLGEKVALSPPAVFERVRRLERDGVVRRFTIEIDPSAVGLHVCAFVRVRARVACRLLAASLARFKEVEECHAV